MKVVINTLIILLISGYVCAQNGKIVERKEVNFLLNEQIKDRVLDEKNSDIRFKKKIVI